MCADVGTEPAVPRRCSCQTHRSNVPADTSSEYYCRSLSIPLLDHLLSEMRSRFSSHQKTALLGLSIVPSILVNLQTDDYTTKVSKLANLYRDDLPSPDCNSSELDCWRIKWEQHLQEHGRCSLPSTPVVTVRHASSMYPNIRALVTILCTLPVTSCSAERSFQWTETHQDCISIVHDHTTTNRTDAVQSPTVKSREFICNVTSSVRELCQKVEKKGMKRQRQCESSEA